MYKRQVADGPPLLHVPYPGTEQLVLSLFLFLGLRQFLLRLGDQGSVLSDLRLGILDLGSGVGDLLVQQLLPGHGLARCV